VARGERGHDEGEAGKRATQEQECDQEENVIRADQDVLDPRNDEVADDRPRSCATRVKHRGLTTRVDDRLAREHTVLIDVHESLMDRILRKDQALHHKSLGPRPGDRETEPEAASIGEGFESAPGDPCLAAIESERDPRRQGSKESFPVARRRLGTEQRVRLGQAELAGNVEVVNNQGARDSTCVQTQVEVAEWRGVGPHDG
jgi:hypothetical protein